MNNQPLAGSSSGQQPSRKQQSSNKGPCKWPLFTRLIVTPSGNLVLKRSSLQLQSVLYHTLCDLTKYIFCTNAFSNSVSTQKVPYFRKLCINAAAEAGKQEICEHLTVRFKYCICFMKYVSLTLSLCF